MLRTLGILITEGEPPHCSRITLCNRIHQCWDHSSGFIFTSMLQGLFGGGGGAVFSSHSQDPANCVLLCAVSSRLAEAGHRVAGVEFSEKAVKDFFTENHLPYKLEQVDKLVKYTVSA